MRNMPRFIVDKGYQREELWSVAGWRWRTGSYDATATNIVGDGLARARRPLKLRRQPFWWDDLERANPIFPVVGVTWLRRKRTLGGSSPSLTSYSWRSHA